MTKKKKGYILLNAPAPIIWDLGKANDILTILQSRGHYKSMHPFNILNYVYRTVLPKET